MNKIRYIFFTVVGLVITSVSYVFAQPGPPPTPTVNGPLDPASIAVLVGGGALAVKKIRDKKKGL